MTRSMRVSRRPRRADTTTARIAPLIGAMACFAMLAAACGASPSAGAAATSTTKSSAVANVQTASTHQGAALAFSRCMRSNGVLRFPDPASDGAIPKVSLQRLGVSSARFQSAVRACQHLLPNGGNGPTTTQVQQQRAQALEFSRCMRSHGVTGFPDPDSSGRIPDPASLSPPINQGAPLFQAANRACGKYRPPYFPSNAAYNAYARTTGS